jgi:hypothetical protein
MFCQSVQFCDIKIIVVRRNSIPLSKKQKLKSFHVFSIVQSSEGIYKGPQFKKLIIVVLSDFVTLNSINKVKMKQKKFFTYSGLCPN